MAKGINFTTLYQGLLIFKLPRLLWILNQNFILLHQPNTSTKASSLTLWHAPAASRVL